MPFEFAEVTGVGEVNSAGHHRKIQVIDRVIAKSIFDKKKAEEIGPEGDGGNRIFFEKILQIQDRKPRGLIDYLMRKPHEVVQFVKGFNYKIF